MKALTGTPSRSRVCSWISVSCGGNYADVRQTMCGRSKSKFAKQPVDELLPPPKSY
jgi:hypothetical protein